MKFLQLVCIALMAILISAAFLACSKSKDVISEVQKSEVTVPDPASSIDGIWTGKYYGVNKSIPVHFGFAIKPAGKLDVLNAEKDVIGSGNWTLQGTMFKVTYTIASSGAVYSLAADLYDSPDWLTGTWGYNNSDTNGGGWSMSKSL